MLPVVRTLTPPASDNLISLSTVKLYLGETTTDRDTLLTSLISTASSSMISFLGVHPGHQRYQEEGFGNGLFRFYLSRLPVEAGSVAVELGGEVLVEGEESENWSLEDPAIGLIYREGLWTRPTSGATNLSTTYRAGFLLPDQIGTWIANTPYSSSAVARWVRPTLSSFYLLRFECTTSGTSGASEPNWTSTIGATVTDGTAVWTARAVQELPPFVSQWCYAEVLRLLSSRSRPAGVASWEVDGVMESYFATQTEGELGPGVLRGLQRWRPELGVVGVM